jgi:23S rRNA (cytidine2498-2'-O)-methyltransferase
VPDADETNPLAPRADALAAEAIAEIAKARDDLALRRVDDPSEALKYGGWQAQLLVMSEQRTIVGGVAAQEAPCLAPGGRARVRMPKISPSRAGRKLVEAIDWLGRGPEAGDVCVDLGAAPGGWSAVVLERRAQVVAVDPAALAPELRGKKGLAHVKTNAFDFTPSEPVDWLLCDMAYRPLEVAGLLAKWGRRRLARTLIANIKLPMKQRVEFVQRVLKIIAEGGWQDVRARQLYHDREEITLTAWRT